MTPDSPQKPCRVQLSRKKGWRMPEGAKKVDRSSPMFGNPFVLGEPVPAHWLPTRFGDVHENKYGRWITLHRPEQAVDAYRWWIALPEQEERREIIRATLRGRVLACWCPLTQPCHADILLEIANAP